MLAALILIVSCYVLTRMVEVFALHTGDSGRVNFLRGCAVVTILLTFVSCSDAMMSAGRGGATLP